MLLEQETKPIFGISVLETLTVGMYTNPLDALRELVQNSVDAIWDAQRAGILTEAEARIEITIDLEKRRIIVRDNGTGIRAADAVAFLSNVGHSTKSLGDNIGFRGIGRLHGIAYCERVEFRTSAIDEEVMTEVCFDAKELRELMSPAMRSDERAEDILYASTYLSTKKENAQSHFFEATLNNVTLEVPQLLDFAEIQDYLSQVGPVNFDTPFIWAPKIKKWARDHSVDIPSVPVFIKSGGAKERYVYKPYRTRYKPLRDTRDDAKVPDIEIDDIAFFPTESPVESGFWIWYSKSNLLGQIGDRNAAGLRLRKHNMSIGGAARIEDLLKESRFNRYFIGEVHIISSGCIPNARRDGFEDTEDWARIREALATFMREREKEVRNESKSRSDPVGRAIQAAITVADKAKSAASLGVAYEVEREKILGTVADNKAKLNAVLPSKLPSHLQESFDNALVALDEAASMVESAPYVVAQTKGQLDRKQKKLLQDILETLGECLPPDMFKLARNAIMSRFEPKESK